MKTCSSCEIEKELDEFPKGKKYTDGRRGVCKICTVSYSRKYTIKQGEYKCIVCNENKLHNEFHSCPQNKNGLRQTCKDCTPTRSRDFMKVYYSDLNFRLKHCLRTRIRHSINSQNVSKSNKTPELVGCSIMNLKTHLESKFTEGMTFENYGEWHIDHIRPCASFNLEDPEEQKKCFHWTNLQPLWALDNIRKGDKWDDKA